ncbi:hypothetical protein GGE45_004397 [Rhizobium aethiopicum]|uniref:CHAT domain-containing protein n=1 Tax=Rhizobium aethiopicum TaxID=1138170 RepID=A0A7W6Q7G2_9HYPH|nr:hypothetical protein [Rhizobium aethiopicum]MBB4192210.1 hypothetical protein [Rhizobium aethiopicum]MBB4582042.1 hypothetical protein [Rhizobium aethiopicum]
MTIFFVSSTDPATQANHAIALQMLEQNDVTLFAADATRARLHSEFQAAPEDNLVFAMSHGSPNALWDSNGEEALSADDAANLQGYNIFCWACHTAKELGQSFAAYGSTWWGYDCAITAPDPRPPYSTVFRDILLNLKQSFPAGVDAASVAAVFATTRAACVDAETRLEEIGASDDDDAMSIYSCCNQIWQHLCVWLAGQGQPIFHPDAPSSSIFG